MDFHYPTRPEFQVLRRLNLDIPAGQTVALVGPSGSGKSSCIQLLLRYYDPLLGTLNLDGIPTTEFPIRQLRFHIGLVSQEPVLFNRTIAENIAYGDNSRIVPLTEIIAAAEMANIHRFITSLPLVSEIYAIHFINKLEFVSSYFLGLRNPSRKTCNAPIRRSKTTNSYCSCASPQSSNIIIG